MTALQHKQKSRCISLYPLATNGYPQNIDNVVTCRYFAALLSVYLFFSHKEKV